jgi:hypothetical protein
VGLNRRSHLQDYLSRQVVVAVSHILVISREHFRRVAWRINHIRRLDPLYVECNILIWIGLVSTRDAIYGADNGPESRTSRYAIALINRASQFHPSVGSYWPPEDFRFHFFAPAGCSALNPPFAEIGETDGQARNSGSAFYLYTEDLRVQAFHFVREIGFYPRQRSSGIFKATLRTEINVSHMLVLVSAVESLLICLLFTFSRERNICYFISRSIIISFLFSPDLDFFYYRK